MNNTPTMTPQEATAMLEADKQQRAQAFADYIEAGRKQFQCDIVGVPKYVAAGNGSYATVVELVIVAR